MNLVQNLSATAFVDVSKWNQAFSITPARNADLRLSITGEEILELARAKTTKDKADALCDILWTLCGTAIDFGVELNMDVLVDRGIEVIKSKKYNSCDYMYSLSYFLSACIEKRIDNSTLEIVNSGTIGASVIDLINLLGEEGAARAWNQVKTTNFAKLWTLEEVNTHKSANPESGYNYVQVGENSFAVRNANNKIMKPASWREPDWSWITT